MAAHVPLRNKTDDERVARMKQVRSCYYVCSLSVQLHNHAQLLRLQIFKAEQDEIKQALGKTSFLSLDASLAIACTAAGNCRSEGV